MMKLRTERNHEENKEHTQRGSGKYNNEGSGKQNNEEEMENEEDKTKKIKKMKE